MLPEARFRIFVYGTLKEGHFYYQRICRGRVIGSFPARARGRLYHLEPGFPGLVEGDDWVFGEVLCFDDPTLLRDLDELEGYDPRRSSSENEYDRVPCQVFDAHEHPLALVETYRMRPETVRRLNGIYLPQGVWTPPQG